MVASKSYGEGSRAGRNGPVSFLRGLFLLFSCFVGLSLIVPFGLDTLAEVGEGPDASDFPELFEEIDSRLEQSYLDLERVQPRPLVERALSSLELSADTIYVESFDPAKPYVAMHVENNVEVLNLHSVRSREDSVRLLENVFEFLSRHYQGENTLNDLRYAAANGYLSGIDPHTNVFTPQNYEEFEIHIRGEIFGVGMMVGSTEDGKLEVKQVLKDTPAFRAGFHKGDVIAKIEDESTINMTVMEAVQKIRGPKDTEVVLTVKRPSKKDKETLETLAIPVKRDRVVIKSVESKLITDKDLLGEKGSGIGYLKVTNFDQQTTPSLLRNLDRLENQNGDRPLGGLIIDLRDNSGGLLTEAIQMADIFLKSGDIVITAGKDDRLRFTSAKNDHLEPDYPVILLANESSASGAEIVLGALQRNDRALVLGTRTFGKGSVQQLQKLPHGAQLKITVSEYLLPGKVSIQENGVVPDILAQRVVLDAEELDLFPNEDRMKEIDYESHIVSKYVKVEEPSYRLKYLQNATGDGEEGPTPSERFIDGDLDPETDPLVRMALQIVGLANEEPFQPKKLLGENQAAFDRLEKEFYAEIVEHLAKMEIDWSAPPASEDPAPSAGALDLELEHEIIEEPSKDAEDPVPVPHLLVRAKLTNRSEKPYYRIKGISRSDYYLYQDREFLFGRIDPGMTVVRTQKIRLPYFQRHQNNVFSLEVSGQDGNVFLTRSAEIVLKGEERPVFAYSAELRNAGGEMVERLALGDDASLKLTIINDGKATAHKGVAILRNKTGRQVFLKKGRIDFSELGPGESTDVEFRFDVRPGDTVERYEFEFVVFDSYSGESLSRELEIVADGEKGPAFPNGVVFRPPSVDMELAAPETEDPVLVTDADEAVLLAKVASEQQNFKVWVTNLPLTPRNKTPDKVFFRSSGGKPEVSLKTPVRLTDGLNLVTLVTKDSNGLETRRSAVVRKREQGTRTAGASGADTRR